MRFFNQNRWWIAYLALVLLVVLLTKGVLVGTQVYHTPELSDNTEVFRAFRISGDWLARWGSDSKEAACQEAAIQFLYEDGEVGKDTKLLGKFSLFRIMFPENKRKPYEQAIRSVLYDAKVFPVKPDESGEYKLSYEDSWGAARAYGGKRRHEGCDVMTDKKEPGYFSVVSISDGVIEKKGWLELGGYRIGIRSPSGAYFYYAHLDSYELGLPEGTEVSAGQVIGKMGNSGYGEEGTKGKFDTHLHLGIYIELDGEEISVNPYEVLRYTKALLM